MNFELEMNFDLDIDDFAGEEFDDNDTMIIKPPKTKATNILNFNYAKDLAKQIEINQDTNYFTIVSGKFVMGDFYAALLLEHNLTAEIMQIMTLSYSEYNINVLARLKEIGKVKQLDLITSEYFFSHNRNSLIKLTYEKLRQYKDFQLAITRSHCKTTLIKTECGKHLVIHGSSNMRSCKNAEQIHIQNCETIFNFLFEYNNKIISKFKTIRRKSDEA